MVAFIHRQAMRIRLSLAALSAVLVLGGGIGPVRAQGSRAAPGATGVFLGRLLRSIDSLPAQGVEVRLLFVDSSKTVKTRGGSDSLDVFIDSLRTRIGATDSTGNFAIRLLAPGHYLMRFRRIGFQQLEGVLNVGADTVRATFTMQVVSRLLAQVTITETAVDCVKQQLTYTGFNWRSRAGASGRFIDRQKILARRRDTLGQILQEYGIWEGDVLLDRMPLDFGDIRDYPTDLVIGIEIYRHNRPSEFNMTRASSASAFSSRSAMGNPLIVVWTYIPGR